MPRAAVVLSGCGVFDGSEIHEAVSVLMHLSRAGATVTCFAPDIELDTVDHLAGKPTGEHRSVLTEAARIARGQVKPLTDLHAADFDTVLFPGGFGAAKNLSDFGAKGVECAVEDETARVIREFHAAGKPIGMCCIAPVLAARVLGAKSGGPGCAVTVGSGEGVAPAIAAWGAEHVAKPVNEAHVDETANLVTAPAYMCGDAAIHEVDDGIGEMVRQTLARAGS